MSSREESAALRILRTQAIRNLAMLIGALALVAWAISNAFQARSNAVLVEKNENLVVIVEDLERQNEDLVSRLKCRQRVTDSRDDAIGRGLAAVANDDSEELARQAQILIDIANENQCQ